MCVNLRRIPASMWWLFSRHGMLISRITLTFQGLIMQMHEPLIKNYILPGAHFNGSKKEGSTDACTTLSSCNNENFCSLNMCFFFLFSPWNYKHRYGGEQSCTLQRDSRQSRTLIGKVEKVVDAIIQYYACFYIKRRSQWCKDILILLIFSLIWNVLFPPQIES